MLKVKLLIFLLLCISVGKGWAQNSLSRKEAKKDTVANVSQLNEVVVTAQFEPKSIKNSIYKVKLLNADRIKLSGATSLQQVLNTEPGFRFSNNLALGVADFEMMGMSGRSIKILLDGMPVVDRSDERESLNQIDINSIERVEIVEGPVSVIYGTDALAGVINIISKQPQQNQWQVNARLQDETVGSEYRAFSGAGSHNQHLSANWAQKEWNVLAGFSRNQFGGWNIPAYTTPIDEMPITWWRPKEQYLANAKLGYKTNKVTINYRIDGLDEDIDSRFGLNPRSYVGKFQTYNTLRLTQQLQSQWILSPKLSLTGMWGYTHLQRGTKTIYNNFATGEETLGTAAGEQDVAKFNSAIFRGISLYKINTYFSLQSGIEYNRDAAAGARIKDSPVINDVALFALGGIVLGRFSFLPGFRLIKNSVYPAPPIIPSFNTKIALSKNLDWRLGYAKGFRAPALRELYFDFVDASHTIYGNPDLKAEQSDSFNSSFTLTAVQKKQVSWVIDVKTFYSFIKNRIAFAQDPSNIQVTSLFNIEKYRTAGLGLEQSVVFKRLKGTVAFAYIGRYNNLLAEGIATNTPLMMWTPEVSTNISYAFSKIGTHVALFYKYTGNRPAYEKAGEGAKLIQISDFNWADLMIDQKINPYLSLNAGVKNLFNITELNNTSTASAGPHSSGGGAVPMSYGRSFVLGLNLTWNKLNKEK